MRISRRIRAFAWLALLVSVTPLIGHAQPAPGRATRRAGQHTVDLKTIDARAVAIQQPTGEWTKIDPDTSRATVKPWQYIAAIKADASPVAVPSTASGAASLPLMITTADADGTQLDLDARVHGDNLMIRGADRSVYSGNVFVAIYNRADPTASGPLGAPVELLVTGDVESATPKSFRIDHFNLPAAQVVVITRSPQDPVKLKFVTSFDPKGIDVTVGVTRPRLAVSAPATLSGYGLGEAQITVQSEGLQSPEGLSVTLRGDPGVMTPSVVKLDASGFASATLRSSETATGVVVTASAAGGLVGQSQPIRFTPPWLFLFCSLLGGLLGAAIKKGGASASPRWPAALALGGGFGLLSALLYTLGVSIDPRIPAGMGGQAVVVVIAAIGALTGVAMLTKKK